MVNFPPAADTLALLNPNNDASVQQYSGQNRQVATQLIAVENALAAGTGVKKTYKFTYDFAVLGGAVSTITLTAPDGALPINFVIMNAFIDVITGFTGAGGCTGAISTGQTANDLVSATVVAGAPFSTAGVKVTIPLLGTIATWIKTTAARSPTFAIAVGAVTAGKFNLFVEGYVSA